MYDTSGWITLQNIQDRGTQPKLGINKT
jgi:hypothetical protein